MVITRVLKKEAIKDCENFKEAQSIFNKLVEYMNQIEIQEKLKTTHKRGVSSFKIQEIIAPKMDELGFTSEKTGLFKEYPVKSLRPDYFLKLTEKSGILIEVERGKTIANNMDLLDIWKCHICKNADYLFLVVPKIRQTEKSQTAIIDKVINRMTTFFEEHNYLNINGLFIIGY